MLFVAPLTASAITVDQMPLLQPVIGPQKPLHAVGIPDPSIDLCSCVKYARSLLPNIPIIRTPRDLTPNASAKVGLAVLMNYDLPHIAIVTDVGKDGFWITEANFRTCRKGERFIEWDDPHVRGFWKPLSTPTT